MYTCYKHFSFLCTRWLRIITFSHVSIFSQGMSVTVCQLVSQSIHHFDPGWNSSTILKCVAMKSCTVMAPRGWILLTLAVPRLYIECNHKIDMWSWIKCLCNYWMGSCAASSESPQLFCVSWAVCMYVCVLACMCLCNALLRLNSLSSHQMQQVSVQPSTDSGLCPTGRPSSRSWLAWLTRTHLAPRPWPRGKHPVWISSNSCWLGPTQIWVRDTHPKVSTYLSAWVTMCALGRSTCLPVALVSLYISQPLLFFSFFVLFSKLFHFFTSLHTFASHS